jgi:nucleoside-diphosphate-sugar epimerase
MKVLLTGATGFVGSQVFEHLTGHGDEVRVLVRPESLASAEKAMHLRRRDNVEVFLGQLNDADVLAKATEAVEVVYHLAAQHVKPGARAEDLISTNVKGTETLLDACVANQVRRFVFTSSVAVYFGSSKQVWITEDDPVKAEGTYGQTKIEAENLIRCYHRDHALEYTVLRLTQIYRPHVPLYERRLKRILNHPWLSWSLVGPGIIQWVHLTDATAAVVLAGTHTEAANQTFHIAANEAVTSRQFIAIVLAAADPRWREGVVLNRFANEWQAPLQYDVSKAQALLGFNPKVKLEEGIAELISALDEPRATNRWD